MSAAAVVLRRACANLPLVSGRKTARFPLVITPLALKRGLIVLLGSGICLNAFLVWSERQELAKGYADFTIFYSAANIVRSGHGSELYDEQVQYRAQLAAAPNVKIRNVALPYNHPPFEALLFLPLSYLPYLAAYLTWVGINLAMLLIAVWLLRRAGPFKTISTAKFFLLALIFFPVFLTIYQGQDLLLLLLIVCSSYVCLRKDADFLAGCALGLGVFRPELALPFALIIAFVRKKVFVAGFILSALSMALVSVWVVGWRTFCFYPKYVYDMERISGHGSIVSADMPNFRGFISLFFHGEPIALILTALVSMLVTAYVLRCVRSVPKTIEANFFIAILFSLLVSYHALVHDLGLLLIPIVFTWGKRAGALDQVSDIRDHGSSLAPAAFFLCTPLLVWLWLGLGLFSLAALVLTLWLWSSCSSQKRQPTPVRALRTGHT